MVFWYSHEENGKDCVASLNPKLYRHCVDDSITKRKKNATNYELFTNINSHHKNIKLTVESNQLDFLTQPSMLNLTVP